MRATIDRRHDQRPIGVACVMALAVLLFPSVSAFAQASAYNSIGLEWVAGGDDGTVGRASAYELRYRTTAVGSDTTGWWNQATAVPSGSLPIPPISGTVDSTRVTGLQPGTTYYFIIRAVDDGGNRSAYSNVASATTLVCDAPTAAPGAFTAVADTGAVDLSWSGSDPSATALKVYRAAGSGSMSLRATLAPSALSYRDTSVQPGATYSYRVAWAADCADGPSSATQTVTLPGTQAPAATPEADLHAFPNPSSDTVQFVIRVPGATDQRVRIRVFDLTGHWIATVTDQTFPPGEHQIPWPRTDRSGRRIAPGSYEAIGSVGTARVRERIILLP